MKYRYQIFDRILESEIELAELSPAGDEHPDMTCRQEGRDVLEDCSWRHVHDWRLSDGSISLSCFKADDRYRLRFPGLADFVISEGAVEIFAVPASTTDDTTLRHLLLDQVVPRILGHQGRLILHAAGVSLQEGRAIALAGETGWGKSTLAAALEQNGAGILSDDCLLLELSDGSVEATPAYPGMRLLPESLAALYPEQAEHSPLAQYTTKRRMPLERQAFESGICSMPLDALFLLSNPESKGGAREISIGHAGGRAALIRLVSSLFVLDVRDRQRMSRAFERCGDLLRSGLPVFTLAYPRRHERLAEVCRAVMNDAAWPVRNGGRPVFDGRARKT